MVKITAQRGEVEAYVMEFVADKVTDIEEYLSKYACAPGSTCIVIEDSSVWMRGNDKQWHEL